jgi:hypothetical protein
MTSWPPPDYDIEIAISTQSCQILAGFALSTKSIIFDGGQQPTSGMIIILRDQARFFAKDKISQTQNHVDNQVIAKAWIWVGDPLDMPKGAKLTLVIDEPCDPMYDPEFNSEEYTPLLTQIGLRLEGVVTKNWKLESLYSDDLEFDEE